MIVFYYNDKWQLPYSCKIYGFVEMENKAKEEDAAAIDHAVETAEKFKPNPRSIYEHVYSYMPEILKEELDEAEANNFWQGVIE